MCSHTGINRGKGLSTVHFRFAHFMIPFYSIWERERESACERCGGGDIPPSRECSEDKAKGEDVQLLVDSQTVITVGSQAPCKLLGCGFLLCKGGTRRAHGSLTGMRLQRCPEQGLPLGDRDRGGDCLRWENSIPCREYYTAPKRAWT